MYHFGMTANGVSIDGQTVDLLENLSREMQGELDWSSLDWGSLGRTLYGTDALAYQETPLAVAFPETEEDWETENRNRSSKRGYVFEGDDYRPDRTDSKT